MDILGFFDGLFSAFSTMCSGKKVDEERVDKAENNTDLQTSQKLERLHQAQRDLAQVRKKSRSHNVEQNNDRDIC